MGIFEVILAFMEKGGNVLWLIAALVFFMWTLIFERVWYFTSVWKADRDAVVSAWEVRSERKSWNAKKIRERKGRVGLAPYRVVYLHSNRALSKEWYQQVRTRH